RLPSRRRRCWWCPGRSRSLYSLRISLPEPPDCRRRSLRPCVSLLLVVLFVALLRRLPIADYDHRRPQHAAAELVAAPHLGDHFVVLARPLAHGLVDVGVERLAVGADLADAGGFKGAVQLALDRLEPFEPAGAGVLLLGLLDRAVEIVDRGQQVDDERAVGEQRVLFALLLRAPLEVLEVGRGALPAGEVGVRLLALGVELLLQLRLAAVAVGVRGARRLAVARRMRAAVAVMRCLCHGCS